MRTAILMTLLLGGLLVGCSGGPDKPLVDHLFGVLSQGSDPNNIPIGSESTVALVSGAEPIMEFLNKRQLAVNLTEDQLVEMGFSKQARSDDIPEHNKLVQFLNDSPNRQNLSLYPWSSKKDDTYGTLYENFRITSPGYKELKRQTEGDYCQVILGDYESKFAVCELTTYQQSSGGEGPVAMKVYVQDRAPFLYIVLKKTPSGSWQYDSHHWSND